MWSLGRGSWREVLVKLSFRGRDVVEDVGDGMWKGMEAGIRQGYPKGRDDDGGDVGEWESEKLERVWDSLHVSQRYAERKLTNGTDISRLRCCEVDCLPVEPSPALAWIHGVDMDGLSIGVSLTPVTVLDAWRRCRGLMDDVEADEEVEEVNSVGDGVDFTRFGERLRRWEGWRDDDGRGWSCMRELEGLERTGVEAVKDMVKVSEVRKKSIRAVCLRFSRPWDSGVAGGRGHGIGVSRAMIRRRGCDLFQSLYVCL
mgnify:CR=1 FL=1|jgi:hypothetical protein